MRRFEISISGEVNGKFVQASLDCDAVCATSFSDEGGRRGHAMMATLTRVVAGAMAAVWGVSPESVRASAHVLDVDRRVLGGGDVRLT